MYNSNMKGRREAAFHLLIFFLPPFRDGWVKLRPAVYIEWMGTVFLECQRVLKDNGSFYFFHNDMPQIAQLMEWIRQNTKFVFKQLITWCKIDPSFSNYGFVQQRLSNGTARNYYGGFTEYCLYYTFQDGTGSTTVMLDTNNLSTLRQYFKDFQEALGLTKKEIISDNVLTIVLDGVLANGIYALLKHTKNYANYHWSTSSYAENTRTCAIPTMFALL